MLTPIFNPPVQKNLFNSASRAGAYDLASALADVIDNSITAGASKVEILINFNYEDLNESSVVIADNGNGMSWDELRVSMQLASEDPEREREISDLGRFGFGMKSASLSQGRKFTVISRKEDGELVVALWDKDSDYGDWMMPMGRGVEADPFVYPGTTLSKGTQVIWSRLAHATENYSLSQEELVQIQSETIEELRLTFHRFLADDLALIVNGAQLTPRNPFSKAVEREPARQLDCYGQTVLVQTFNLPHYGNLTAEEEEDLGGPEGAMKNQGFYVYRNKRLIIYGTWFGLVKHSAAYQLSRIRIDVPNSLDQYWKISIDKKNAQPPQLLRNQLKKIIRENNRLSINVMRRKSVRQKITLNHKSNIWEKISQGGIQRFRINREHPLVDALTENSDQETAQAVEALLSVIEATLPTQEIENLIKNEASPILQTFIDSQGSEQVIESSLQYLINCGLSNDELYEVVATVEPFSTLRVQSREILNRLIKLGAD